MKVLAKNIVKKNEEGKESVDNQLLILKANSDPKISSEKSIQKKNQEREPSEGNDLQFFKSIKQLQVIFDKKFLGNKNQSKSQDLKRVQKLPTFFTPDNLQNLLGIKTGNLNTKMKQIQTIFKAQQKNKKKKKPILNFTDFQLYLAKRDILKEKIAVIDELRKQYQQQKNKDKHKKTNKNKRPSFIQPTDRNINHHQQNQNHQSDKNQPNQRSTHEININTNPQNHTPLLQSPSDFQRGSQTLKQETQNSVLKINKIMSSFLANPLEDEYYQKKFEQNIVKNKLASSPGFSIRALLQPSGRRKTTVNQDEVIKKELNEIQTIAKSTIQNYQTKQKINKIIYAKNFQSESASSFSAKRYTPTLSEEESSSIKQTKTINWIIKQCQSFKKQFKVRKSKSLRIISKNQ